MRLFQPLLKAVPGIVFAIKEKRLKVKSILKIDMMRQIKNMCVREAYCGLEKKSQNAQKIRKLLSVMVLVVNFENYLRNRSW